MRQINGLLFLILDEVDSWFNEISDQPIRERNRYFLEKLSEVANERDLNFILITALRAEFEEPKRTLSRECRIINLHTRAVPSVICNKDHRLSSLIKSFRRFVQKPYTGLSVSHLAP